MHLLLARAFMKCWPKPMLTLVEVCVGACAWEVLLVTGLKWAMHERVSSMHGCAWYVWWIQKSLGPYTGSTHGPIHLHVWLQNELCTGMHDLGIYIFQVCLIRSWTKSCPGQVSDFNLVFVIIKISKSSTKTFYFYYAFQSQNPCKSRKIIKKMNIVPKTPSCTPRIWFPYVTMN